MTKVAIGALSIFAVCSLLVPEAKAADATPPVECFEVLVVPASFSAFPFLIVNKCTGNTWILIKTPSVDTKGTPNGYVFQWRQLNFSTTQGDALFGP